MLQRDAARAEIVFGRLLAALNTNEYPFNIAQLPQRVIPRQVVSDPLSHAQFVFFTCHFMRGAIKSDVAIRQLVALWHKHPGLFDPAAVVERYGVDQIASLLKSAINYHIDEIAPSWLENARRLITHYQGDPRKIFEGARNADDVRDRVTNKRIRGVKPENEGDARWGFEGFQGKMASMLAYFLLDAGLIDPLSIPPAVDFHLHRVMLATKVLIPEGGRNLRYDQTYPRALEVIAEYMAASGTTTLHLGDALWIISSELCARAPGNRSVGRKKKWKRRVKSETGQEKKERKFLPQSFRLDESNMAHLRQYAISCGKCPIADLCEWSVPSGPYYEAGLFRLHRRERLGSVPELFKELPDHFVPRRVPGGSISTAFETQQLSLFPED